MDVPLEKLYNVLPHENVDFTALRPSSTPTLLNLGIRRRRVGQARRAVIHQSTSSRHPAQFAALIAFYVGLCKEILYETGIVPTPQLHVIL